jgi:hypothetical protein
MNLRERILAAVPPQGIHRRALLNALSHEYAPALDAAIASMMRDGTLVEREPDVYFKPEPAQPTKRKRKASTPKVGPPKRHASGGAITECVMCGRFKRKAAEEVCGECKAEMDSIFGMGVA